MAVKLNKQEEKECEDDIKKLLEENLKITKEIHEMVKSVKSFVVWQRAYGVLKLLIIIIPLVIGFIYLPPLLQEVFGQYKSIIKSIAPGAPTIDMSGIDLKSISPEIIKGFMK